jgi:phage shock protein A
MADGARGACYSHPTAMGILDRLSTLIKSNLNDAIDSMQDPGKEIDQMVLDLEDSAKKARGEVAGCMAEEKRLTKRAADLVEEARTWETRATQAVSAGDDTLAKEALRRKAEKDAERLEVEKSLREQQAYVDQLTAGLKALDARVKDVKSRQGTLREKARAAKGQSPVSTKTSAFNEFERMSGKIDAVEAEASLTEELSGETPQQAAAGRKLEELSQDKSVDDALAALKKKLSGG